MYKKLFFLLVIALVFGSISCEKSPTEQNNNNSTITSSQTESKPFATSFKDLTISVPDSVPEKVGDWADEIALKYGCDGIRFLQVENKEKVKKFHLQFFIDEAGIDVYECFMAKDGTIEEISPDNANYINSIWENKHKELNKSNHGDHYCLPLAEFYKDADYSGPMFRVTQAAHMATGYFHKLINCLMIPDCLIQCDGSIFPGNFNSCISSHKWVSFRFQSYYYTWPAKVKVYFAPGRVFLKWTFSGATGGSCASHDSNWADNGDANDKANSLRLEYYIHYGY